MRNSTINSNTRGRPRKFDEKVALSKAAKLFSEKGYSATSLDDLSHAMELKRPSIYNAFGNKESIFIKAVDNYFNRIATPLAKALKNESIEQAFDDFFSRLLDFYCEDNNGCMATSTMPVESSTNDSIKTFYGIIMTKIDALIQNRLEQEWPSEKQMLRAQLLQALMQTLSLRARCGVQRSDLENLYQFGLQKILQ